MAMCPTKYALAILINILYLHNISIMALHLVQSSGNFEICTQGGESALPLLRNGLEPNIQLHEMPAIGENV
jgi:hypothetical protein